MKKLLTLAIVFSLALVLNSVCFAQDAQAPVEAPMTIENVVGEGEVVMGSVDACGPIMPCQPCPRRPFFRRNCAPAFAAPCNPAPCMPAPCCEPAPRRFCAKPACSPCVAAPCRAPFASPCAAPCASPCVDPCDPCGAPMARRTPIRNFFARLFAGRCGGGYDAYGCDPCGAPACGCGAPGFAYGY